MRPPASRISRRWSAEVGLELAVSRIGIGDRGV